MTLNLAEQLIRRLATDPVFRQYLAALDGPAKRALLDASGYRGVTAEWLQSIALTAFKDLTGEKVGEDDAMAAVTAATTAAASVPAASAGVLNTGAPAACAGVLNTGVPTASAGVLNTGVPTASAGVLNTGVPTAAAGVLNTSAPATGAAPLQTPEPAPAAETKPGDDEA